MEGEGGQEVELKVVMVQKLQVTEPSVKSFSFVYFSDTETCSSFWNQLYTSRVYVGKCMLVIF